VEHVLGKITGDFDKAGGPDALLEIVVDRSWLQQARTIEVDLPRNLGCAACEGAGCNICNQSGAITVRERSEPAEVLRVTLPRQELAPETAPDSQRVILLRIQGRGGLPSSGVWPSQRGRLLLRVKAIGTLSDCVHAVPDDQIVSSSTLTRADVIIPDPESAVSPKTYAAQPKQSQFSTGEDQGTAQVEVQSPGTRRSFAPDNSELRAVAYEASDKLAIPKPAKVPRKRWGGLRLRDALIGLLLLLMGAAAAWLLL
jgi:hypothetical protein